MQPLSPSLLLLVFLTSPIFSSVFFLLPLFSISVFLIRPELPLTHFLFLPLSFFSPRLVFLGADVLCSVPPVLLTKIIMCWLCRMFMFVSLKSAPVASWKTAIILASRQRLFGVPCACVRAYSPSYMCERMCAHDELSVQCVRARACECESVIVTWLIHHGQSPFDYKRRGPVINRRIQLPGPSCDTRSQSICTDTPPSPHCRAPAYPHTACTPIHPPTHAPKYPLPSPHVLSGTPLPSALLSPPPTHALPFPRQPFLPCTPLFPVLS